MGEMDQKPAALGAPIARLAKGLGHFRELLDMIKFEHTVFALPFAALAALAATEGRAPLDAYFWVLVAMVGARTLAMTFNRVADADRDRENPRTSNRALPAGRVRPWMAWLMVGASACAFGMAAAKLGPLPTKLAPYAFALLLGYSLAKRFTALSHAMLGLALACAPLGAWIAVAGRPEPPAWWLSFGVLAWTAGFDILYALQDRDFDAAKGLCSAPAAFGVAVALRMSRLCHLLAVAAWAMFLAKMGATLLPWLSLAAAAAILCREQWVVRDGNTERLDYAFFTLNSLVGVVMLLGYFAHWARMRGVV
jgi:4-hydroxybenzoate polyprenyltransferase